MNKMEKQLGVISDITLLLLHAQIGAILKGVCGGGCKLVLLCSSGGYTYVMRKRLANWGRGNGEDRRPEGTDHPHCKCTFRKSMENALKHQAGGFDKHPLLSPSTGLLIPVFYNNNSTTNQVSLEFREQRIF